VKTDLVVGRGIGIDNERGIAIWKRAHEWPTVC
jgi:hypothetical protein